MPSPRPPLFTFRFLALCLLMLLAYCNISVFYNLYPYMEQLGVPQAWRGTIISASSVATIAGFLLITPRIGVHSAPWVILAGIGLLVACGVGYLHVTGVPGLFALRIMNGAGIALVTASATTLLVAHIAPERSGQAFGVYSIAALLPYSIVPFVFDHLPVPLSSPAEGYAAMSLALAPAALLALALARGRCGRDAGPERAGAATMLKSLRTPQTALLLLMNIVYYLNFSSLFFLSKTLFAARGLGGVGVFFSIQTMVMLAIRVLGSRLFDEIQKPLLVLWCYGLTALGFGMLGATRGEGMAVATALVLGLGMGVGPPSMNALMFALSERRVQAVNSNLMVMALQAGNFLGPILGGAAVGLLGHDGFLGVGGLSCLVGMWLALLFLRRGWTGGAGREGKGLLDGGPGRKKDPANTPGALQGREKRTI
ncbi:MFS transporter [Humidesulfovibrio mexicanus]|nr:MFS transporter [Humidesulfovibrio mexicanus]